MSTDSVRAADPAAEEFAGDGPAQVAKRLFHATRPKFYPASILPVVAGTAWGSWVAGGFDAAVFLLALFATVCVHAGGNVLNDVGDESGGTDRLNGERIYPYTGGSRFIQTGIMDARAMARLGTGLIVAATLAGLVLVYLRGPMVLAFGIAGLLAAVLYSLGPLRLNSTGIGELIVGFAFGVLPVTGAAWLQSGEITPALIVFSVPVSAWVAAILLINEVPDMQADASADKKTLPVRIGRAGTAKVYLAMHLAGFAAIAWLAVAGILPLVTVVVPALLLALAAKAAAGIRAGLDDRTRMTKSIEATLGVHTIGSLWLTGILMYLAIT